VEHPKVVYEKAWWELKKKNKKKRKGKYNKSAYGIISEMKKEKQIRGKNVDRIGIIQQNHL
jgi:hypothetical protein